MPQERSDIARTVDVMGELDHVRVREDRDGTWLFCDRCQKMIVSVDSGDTMAVLVSCAMQHNRRDCRQ